MDVDLSTAYQVALNEIGRLTVENQILRVELANRAAATEQDSTDG